MKKIKIQLNSAKADTIAEYQKRLDKGVTELPKREKALDSDLQEITKLCKQLKDRVNELEIIDCYDYYQISQAPDDVPGMADLSDAEFEKLKKQYSDFDKAATSYKSLTKYADAVIKVCDSMPGYLTE